MRRDVRLIASHCLGRPAPRLAGEPASERSPATAREAGAAVGSMLARLGRRADADFYEQYRWRAVIVTIANFVERKRCLPSWVARIDRALRRLPLSEPPPEFEEEYVPEREDYGPYE